MFEYSYFDLEEAFDVAKSMLDSYERNEKWAKEEIELMDDDIKNFIEEEMYPVIQSYSSCVAIAEDYGNDVDALREDWVDIALDYIEEEDY